MKCIHKVRGLDMFGQKVNLNYNKLGEEFNSPQGILTSMMILIIVIIYTGIRSNVLL